MVAAHTGVGAMIRKIRSVGVCAIVLPPVHAYIYLCETSSNGWAVRKEQTCLDEITASVALFSLLFR